MSTEIEKKIRISGLSTRFVEYLRTALPRPKLNWRTVQTALLTDVEMKREELTIGQRDLYPEIQRLAPVFLDSVLNPTPTNENGQEAQYTNLETVGDMSERAVAA